MQWHKAASSGWQQQYPLPPPYSQAVPTIFCSPEHNMCGTEAAETLQQVPGLSLSLSLTLCNVGSSGLAGFCLEAIILCRMSQRESDRPAPGAGSPLPPAGTFWRRCQCCTPDVASRMRQQCSLEGRRKGEAREKRGEQWNGGGHW